jgi:hypothetical protein
VQDPTTSPSGDLIPTIRGSGAREDGIRTRASGKTGFEPAPPTRSVCDVYFIEVCVCVCLLLQDLVQRCLHYCRTYYKAVRVGEEEPTRLCSHGPFAVTVRPQHPKEHVACASRVGARLHSVGSWIRVSHVHAPAAASAGLSLSCEHVSARQLWVARAQHDRGHLPHPSSCPY